jgi:rod shape-determining protein MreC
MFKQNNYIAAGIVVLAAVFILSLPPSATSHLKLALGSLFLPLFGLANAGQQLPADLVDSALPRRELLRQIALLRQQVQQLQMQQLQAQATAQEDDRFRDLYGWQRQQPWKLRLARVITRDPANWWRTIEIDQGSHDGIVPNLPVLTPDGLIGRVSSVGLTRSQVILIGDPNCRVSALVQNAAQDTGILSASGPLNSSLADLTYLASNANLKSGEPVVTSGIGGVFPKGIPVGEIVDSRQVEFGLYTEARVKLNVDLGALEEVWVLMQWQ